MIRQGFDIPKHCTRFTLFVDFVAVVVVHVEFLQVVVSYKALARTNVQRRIAVAYSLDVFNPTPPSESSSDSSSFTLVFPFCASSKSSLASSSCSLASLEIRLISASSMSYLVGKVAATPLRTHEVAVIMDIFVAACSCSHSEAHSACGQFHLWM